MIQKIKKIGTKIKNMLIFPYTRKPDFTNINKVLDYDKYWEHRKLELRSQLNPREKIFFNWLGENSSVLDVGCGNSPLLLKCKNEKKCKVLGIDISKKIISVQKENGIPCEVLDVTQSDITGKFDYIILSEILEHIKYPEEIINKLKSKTKYFIISVPNTAYFHYRIGLAIKGRFPTQWVYHPSEHIRFWSHKDFLDWIKALNLKIIKHKSSNGIYTLKNIFPNIFGHQICYLCKVK